MNENYIMNLYIKAKLILFLFLMTSSAYANWVLLGTSDDEDGNMSFYYNSEQIYKDGDFINVWQLVDSGIPRNSTDGKYLSEVTLFSYKCKSREHAVRSVSRYSKNMQSGKIVYSSSRKLNEMTWQPVIPNSFANDVLKFACKN
jgi:hypothetical protein